MKLKKWLNRTLRVSLQFWKDLAGILQHQWEIKLTTELWIMQ
jgi:hypothetical protein